VSQFVKRCSYKTATTCNRKLFRKLLRSGYTGARPRYSRTFTDLGRTYEWMQGSLNREPFRRAGCFPGQGGPPPRPPLLLIQISAKAVSKMRRFVPAACRPGTCCICPRGGEGIRLRGRLPSSLKCVAALRSDSVSTRSFRVNSFRGPTLSPELCSKFLIELAPPVNIAYWRGIMSRDYDSPVSTVCYF